MQAQVVLHVVGLVLETGNLFLQLAHAVLVAGNDRLEKGLEHANALAHLGHVLLQRPYRRATEQTQNRVIAAHGAGSSIHVGWRSPKRPFNRTGA